MISDNIDYLKRCGIIREIERGLELSEVYLKQQNYNIVDEIYLYIMEKLKYIKIYVGGDIITKAIYKIITFYNQKNLKKELYELFSKLLNQQEDILKSYYKDICKIKIINNPQLISITQAVFYLAEAQFQFKDYKNAELNYKFVLEIYYKKISAPTNRIIKTNLSLAKTYEVLKKEKEAIKIYEKIIYKYNLSDIRYVETRMKLIKLYQKKRNYGILDNLYLEVLNSKRKYFYYLYSEDNNLEEKYIEFVYELAEIYVIKGEFDNAKKIYNKILDLYKDDKEKIKFINNKIEIIKDLEKIIYI